ncbi:MAG TPA: SDR family NAD(P)-dependent oxidoreductase [Steroidobacteraceae bacterium]|jgi:short-subunit dehydrogenase|nr:SDR family NAD(P)-dependent oxidoreductase [Steroidobacteraceae bacterium]
MSVATQTFRARYGPSALILGGSEGIGRAFAAQLAARGLDLLLIARRSEALQQAAAELQAAHGVRVSTLALDLSAGGAGARARELTAAHEIGLLICNAGATHGAGQFLDEPLEQALALAQLNCLTTLGFAHAALGAMRARGRGGMIAMSSMSGLGGSGYIAAYAAAKSFLMTLCEGLHAELAPAGVDVLCAVAGLTDTPAMRRSGLSFSAAAAAGFAAMDAAAVARGALEQLGRAALWYAPGDAAAQALRALPRAVVTESMTQAAAALYNLPRR